MDVSDGLEFSFDQRPGPDFSAELARQFVEHHIPVLLARAAANLGEALPDGTTLAAPSTEVASIALASGRQILEQVATFLDAEAIRVFEQALVKLEQLFHELHPERELGLALDVAVELAARIRTGIIEPG